MAERPQAITITDAAAAYARGLLERREDPAVGLRLSIDTKGCSGLSYKVDYAEGQEPMDERVEVKGVTIFIDPKAVMFLLGTEVDYVEDRFHAGFVFNNPLEKGRCGCGESFHI